MSRLPGSTDSAYTFEFPHEQAHLIPQMFPAASPHISTEEKNASWEKRNGTAPGRGRAIEAASFEGEMQRREDALA